MNAPREIETLLHDAAEQVRVELAMPADVRRRIRMRRIGTVVISLSVVGGLILGTGLAIATWSRDPILPSQERDEHEIVVTREDPSLPEGCGVRRATEALLSFTDALSDGDLAALDGAFSREGIFRSVGIANPHGLTGEGTLDRAALMAYLELRVSRAESYRLTKAMVETAIGSPNPGGSGAVRVHFLATRTADDIDGTLEFRGWANLDCPAGDIYVMNLGPLHPSERVERWCPAAQPDSEDAVIACSENREGRRA